MFTKSSSTNVRTLSLSTIQHNNDIYLFDGNEFKIVMNFGKTDYPVLNQSLAINNKLQVSIQYFADKELSVVTRLTDGKYTKELLSGLKFLELITGNGIIESGWVNQI